MQPGMVDILQVVFPGLFPVMKFLVRPKTPWQTVHSFLLDQESLPIRLVPELGKIPSSESHSVTHCSQMQAGAINYFTILLRAHFYTVWIPRLLQTHVNIYGTEREHRNNI